MINEATLEELERIENEGRYKSKTILIFGDLMEKIKDYEDYIISSEYISLEDKIDLSNNSLYKVHLDFDISHFMNINKRKKRMIEYIDSLNYFEIFRVYKNNKNLIINGNIKQYLKDNVGKISKLIPDFNFIPKIEKY